MIRYIELKSDQGDSGPAWIARVRSSRTHQTVYFNGHALKRGSGISGNYYDLVSGEEYWVSGVKKNGQDRHWAGGGIVWIEEDIVEEYLAVVGRSALDTKRFEVIATLPEPDPSSFIALENARLE